MDHVLKNATLLFGGLDISGQTNSTSLAATAEQKECTNFNSGDWREFAGVLKNAEWSFEGFWCADEAQGEPDAVFSAAVNTPVTVALHRPVVAGGVAYGMVTQKSRYQVTSPVGELAGYTLGMRSGSSMVRGQVLTAEEGVSVAGSSAGLDLGGPVAEGKKLHVYVHVLAGAGDLSISVELDDPGFAAPVSAVTVAGIDGVGGFHATASGLIDKQHARATWLVASATEDFEFVVMAAIQ